LKILIARIAREPFSILIFGICVIGSIAIIACWGSIGGDNWRGLLTSLVGLAGGGLLIWLVRVIAASAMHREAMGFGDVTLMCMIGAFLGWQACLILFFVAAAAGLVIGVAQWVFTGDNKIPYGPFLCLGAAIVLVFWSSIWDYLEPSFELGLFIPAVVLACLAIMFVPLLITRIVSDWLFPDRV
jgi:leader peptidase (prepilin peptidase)/N-methyltransferase